MLFYLYLYIIWIIYINCLPIFLNWVFPQLKLLYLFTVKDKSSAKKLINIESQRLPTDFKMSIGEGP